MVGNNSSGSYSLVYQTTRENVKTCYGYLSDGSFVEFGEMKKDEFYKKINGSSIESKIYRQIAFEPDEIPEQVRVLAIEAEFIQKPGHFAQLHRHTGDERGLLRRPLGQPDGQIL